MNATTTRSRYRSLTDAQLEAEVERLTAAIDRLDAATWPAAGAQRSGLIDELLQAEREAVRRRGI